MVHPTNYSGTGGALQRPQRARRFLYVSASNGMLSCRCWRRCVFGRAVDGRSAISELVCLYYEAAVRRVHADVPV